MLFASDMPIDETDETKENNTKGYDVDNASSNLESAIQE